MANTPIQPQLTNSQIARINRRAKRLAQAAYEDFRTRMMEDPLVVSGHTPPEDWQPVDTSDDVLELIRATATSLAATSRSLDRQADRLARNSGKST